MTQAQLTPEQIEKVRELRASKMRFSDIARQVGYTGAPSNLRYHCRDLPGTRRILQPTRYAEESGIRAFTDDEDEKIIAWAKLPKKGRSTMTAFGQSIDRNSASVRARIAWLQKNGRLTL